MSQSTKQDSDWTHALTSLSSAFATRKRKSIQGELEKTLGGSRNYLVSLSVRSAFDLLLTSLSFAPGSEVIMSALNLQDMSQIVEHHGLVVKAVDLQLHTLEPDYHHLSSLIKPNTVMIIVAQLYGRRYHLGKLSYIARKHNLILVEDCAQVYSGPSSLSPSGADISLFSFGNIKHCTGFGGGISYIKSPQLCNHMRMIQSKYPIQKSRTYFIRVLKMMVSMILLNNSFVTWLFLRILRLLNVSLATCHSFLRNFPGDLVSSIRYQPCRSLLQVLLGRMINDPVADRQFAVQNVEYMIQKLPKDKVLIPGSLTEAKHYWLFPILVNDRDYLFEHLVKHGIAATTGATQLTLIQNTEEGDVLSGHKTNREEQKRSIDYSAKSLLSAKQQSDEKVHQEQKNFRFLYNESNNDNNHNDYRPRISNILLSPPAVNKNSDLLTNSKNHLRTSFTDIESCSQALNPINSSWNTENQSLKDAHGTQKQKGIEEPNVAKASMSKSLEPGEARIIQEQFHCACTNTTDSCNWAAHNSSFPVEHHCKSSSYSTYTVSDHTYGGVESVECYYDILQKGASDKYSFDTPVVRSNHSQQQKTAKFIFDHLLYLPVHKHCSRKYLDHVANILNKSVLGRASIHEKAKQTGIWFKSQL